MPQAARLRKVGGSVVVAIPPAMLNDLKLKSDDTVSLDVKDGKLVLEPQPPQKRALTDLIREAREMERTQSDHEWLASAAVGRELL